MGVLGIDYGLRRIGIAASDSLGITAQPLVTLQNRKATVIAELKQIIKERKITQIVLGLPRHMNGDEGIKAVEARAFGEVLAVETGLPVDYMDERLTSVAVGRILTESGMSGAKKRQVVDKMAAVLILQTWMERQKRSWP